MASIPGHIAAFMQDYGVGDDEIWPVPGGKSFAIKHSAIERIAAAQRVKFAPPQIVEADGATGVATIIVSASMGEQETWSFGEASPKNNKNAYPFAMAEKRAKDRCVLKLLNSHGAIYSEEEADDFKTRDAPAERPRGDAQASLTAYKESFRKTLDDCANVAALRPLWKDHEPMRDALGILPQSQTWTELRRQWEQRGHELAPKEVIKKEAAE